MGKLPRFLKFCCSLVFLFLHKKSVCRQVFFLSEIEGICDCWYNIFASAKFDTCQHYFSQIGLNHMLVVSYAVSLNYIWTLFCLMPSHPCSGCKDVLAHMQISKHIVLQFP